MTGRKVPSYRPVCLVARMSAFARHKSFDPCGANPYPYTAMLFNVSSLVQEGIGATRRYDVEGEAVTENREPEPVTGTVELLRTKMGVLVRAHLKLEERETCSRCLKPLRETLALDFEEEFQQTVDARGGLLPGERPDTDAFVVNDQHILDITEAVRQYREASAAIAPLCSEDCKGICPDCGADLNAQECRCDKGPIDSRWADLAGLRSAMSDAPSTEGKD
jgi:uncharacterized protein